MSAPPPTGDDSVAASSNGAGGSFGIPATRPGGGTAMPNKTQASTFPKNAGIGPVMGGSRGPAGVGGAVKPPPPAGSKALPSANPYAHGTGHGTKPTDKAEVDKYVEASKKYRTVHDNKSGMYSH